MTKSALGRFALPSVWCLGLLLLSVQAAHTEEPTDILNTLEKIGTYTKSLKLGATFAQSQTTFGKPRQRKAVRSSKDLPSAAYLAIWDLKGYSIDAQFNDKNRVVSYAVHWFGDPSAIPEFGDVLLGKFSVVEKRGMQTATLEGSEVAIRWTKNSLPDSPKIISILSVQAKPPTP